MVALLALCLCVVGCATFKDVGKHLWPSGQSNPQQAADKGKPLPKDFKSLKALAEKGDARAQFQLANKFYYGEGVAKDYAQSFEWASRSAAQDNPKAKYRLASLYVQGYGIAKDEDKAMALFNECAGGIRKLAEQNDAQAQVFLGVIYYYGQGVEQDFKEALKWYQKAAEQGLASAQYNLGLRYQYGKGVEQNYVTAYAWRNIAATNGNQNAQKGLSQVEMTPEQITEAEALVKEMVKKNPKLLKK